MATAQPELVTSTGSDIFAEFKKVSQGERIVAIFGTDASASTLATCTPVGFNETTGYYGAWLAPDPTVLEVDLTSATAGTFTVTVDEIETGNIAYDATEAEVVAALLSIGVPVSVSEASQVYTITFDGAVQVANVPTVTGDVTSITGGTPAATPTAGTSTYGLSTFVGLQWPDPVTLSATEQVQSVIMVDGRVSYDDIEATIDSGDASALAAELKKNALSRGWIIEDLPNIH